jgi:glycosyltransferase involved in cell wall biosynthesis
MVKKTKICFILSHLPQGGAERQTINLIKGLDKTNYDVTLLIYASKEIFYDEILNLPVELIIRHDKGGNKLIRNLGNAIYLRKFLSENDFEILHTLLFHNGFWVRLAAPAKYNQRIAYSIRNSIQGISGFELMMEKILIRKSYVITNSLKVMGQFLSMVGDKYKDRVTNIYNGIEIDRFMSGKPPEISGKIIIGTVGRQTVLKNQIQILVAINRISKIYPLHFFLIGDNALDRSVDNESYVVNNKLTHCVTILNSQSDIEKYYRRFNIFVLSSISESCPNVLFEAMLAGCICVVSEGSNSDHFIKDGVNGFVYDGTETMLESKLTDAIEMIRNKNIAEMVENAQQYVLNNFTLSRMISGYEKVYGSILNGSTRSEIY